MDDTQTPLEATAKDSTYELSLKGQGIEVERNVGEEVALQILAILMGGGQAGPASRGAAVQLGRTTRGGGRGQSLREFLNQVEAKRNVDKIVAIASYLETERGYETFSSDQIKKEFKTAREPIPANYPRDFKWAVGVGWLAPEPDDPDEYYVTESGRKAVEAKFSPEIKKTTTVGKTERRRRPRKKGDEA